MSEPLAAATDQELLARVRGGEAGAYGELWRRHSGAVTAILRLETRLDADDLTAEVFTRILATIRAGNGPDTAFRPYALVAARNLAAEWGRRGRREIAVADDSLDAESNEPPVDESVAVLPHRHVAARVFSSLPVRWQEVLWYLEVEQLSAAEAAPLVGLNANSTVQLAFRAREGFRQAWIQEHLHGRPAGTRDCAWVDRRVGRYVRGKLASIERGRLERHTSACERCSTLIDEGRSVEGRAIFVLLPALLLGGAASGYLAAAERGETRRSEGDPPVAIRFAKAGDEGRADRSSMIAPAIAIAASALLLAAGIALAQASIEPVGDAQAADDSPSQVVPASVPAVGAPSILSGPMVPVTTDEPIVDPVVDHPSSRDEAQDRPGSPDRDAEPPAAPDSGLLDTPPDDPAPPATPFAEVRVVGVGYRVLAGQAVPGATIEVSLGNSATSVELVTVADAAGEYELAAVLPDVGGTVHAVVRQVVDGVASEWSTPIPIEMPAAPKGVWSWTGPGQLRVETISVVPLELIVVRIDGVVVGTLATTGSSGDLFDFAVPSASVVTLSYENGGRPAPELEASEL